MAVLPFTHQPPPADPSSQLRYLDDELRGLGGSVGALNDWTASPVLLEALTVPTATTGAATLYVDANGSGGKLRLMVRFPTGSSQVIAEEP